jgi:hypothetical protein
MPVSAGVIRDALKSAKVALFNMPPEDRTSADHDMSHHFELGAGQSVVSAEAFTVKTKHICHFKFFTAV